MPTEKIYKVRSIDFAPPEKYDNSSTNLNTYTKTGRYVVPSNASITNTPVQGVAGVLEVMMLDGYTPAIISQYFYGINIDDRSKAIYSRSSTDGGTNWNAWERFVKASGAEFTGPLITKNITVNGNITVGDGGTITVPNINVTGNFTAKNITITGKIETPDDIYCRNLFASANVNGNNGVFTNNVSCVLMNGTAVRSRLADLAEKYVGEPGITYPIGTVMVVSDIDINNSEVRLCPEKNSAYVWGVVSETAAYLMNNVDMDNPVVVGLVGKLPVRVVGSIRKGEPLISNVNGTAIAAKHLYDNTFAISLETNIDENEKLVNCLVGFRTKV